MATTGKRGYGTDHQAERERWRPVVESGHAKCARCRKPMKPDEPWDLGHTDDRTAYNGPEHPACNRGAGGRAGAAIAHANRAMTVRDW